MLLKYRRALICVRYVSDCVETCTFDGMGRSVVVTDEADEHCAISMPDNPIKNDSQTFPCQIEIQANCTGLCHVHLTFAKFELPKCKENITDYEFTSCDQLDK